MPNMIAAISPAMKGDPMTALDGSSRADADIIRPAQPGFWKVEHGGGEAKNSPPRSLRGFLIVLRSTMGLVRTVAPWTFVVGLYLRAAGAVIFALVIVLVREVAGDLSGRETQLLSGQAAIVIGALGMVVSVAGGAVLAERRRLITERVQAEVHRRLLNASASVGALEFEEPEFHDRIKRARAYAVAMPVQMMTGLVQAIGGAFGALAAVAIVFVIDVLLAPVLLTVVITIGLIGLLGARMSVAFLHRITPTERERVYLSGLLTTRQSAAEIRATDARRVLRSRFERLMDERVEEVRRLASRRIAMQVALSLSLIGGLLAVVVLGVWMSRAGRFGAPEVAAGIVALPLIAARSVTLVAGVSGLQEGALLMDDLTYLERRAAARPDPTLVVAPPLAAREGGNCRPPRIQAQNITFTYPTASQPALNNVSIEIRPGQVVALVGENGSGKSTLARILAGLYPPDGGSVLWDGEPTTFENLAARRFHTTIVPQEFIRYELSVELNLTLGAADRHVSREQVEAAAKRAGMHDVFQGLPEGYETVLSTSFAGGHELSGGQWQRVALARAFLRDTPFVILDEPTTSLDARGEYELFRDVRESLDRRSVLLITHRIQSVRFVDRIFVLAEGRVVEDGTHDELLERAGRYASMVALQAATSL